MFCRHVFGNISGGFRGISRFLGKFAGISRKNLKFAGPRPRELSEALTIGGSPFGKERSKHFTLGTKLLSIYLPMQKEIVFESPQHLKKLNFVCRQIISEALFPYNLLFYIATYLWCDFYCQLFTFIM